MRIWAVVALVLISLLGAYRHGASVTDNKWKAIVASGRAADAESRAAAEAGARVEEQRRQLAVNEIRKHARDQRENAAVDAADADSAGRRLHDDARQLAALSAKCPNPTGTAKRSQAATRATMVLSDLLERADQRAGELARAYDRARIAGLTCENTYKNIRKDPRLQ